MLTRLFLFTATLALFGKAAAQSCSDERSPAADWLPVDIAPRVVCEQPIPCNVCDKAVSQLKRGCDPLSGTLENNNPYADTVFGRKRMTITANREQRRAIVAATLSQDAPLALQLTASLHALPDPGLRYAGWLIPTLILLKEGAPDEDGRLETLMAGLREAATDIDFSSADLDYIEAIVLAEAGQRGQALTRVRAALTKEPRFYNALVLGIELQIRQLGKHQYHDAHACRVGYTTLFELLSALMDLNPCPQQAAHAEVYLHRFLAIPDAEPSFLAAQVYLSLIGKRSAHAAHALQRFEQSALPACGRFVNIQLRELIRRTRDLSASRLVPVP